jgi:toxoflavin biosynthesis protein ToxD
VFFDYTSIPSGDFEQYIIGNIKARAHFVLILTPTSLDRCVEPKDWLRREIETAMAEKRNIVPLFFDGFSFGSTQASEKLTGDLARLTRYNGMNVPRDYFQEAMERLHTRFLSMPLDAVLLPLSAEVQKVVHQEQTAANVAVHEQAEKKAGALPAGIIEALDAKNSPNIRAGAVRDLGDLMRGDDPALAGAARALLENLTADDSLKVQNAAKEELNPVVDIKPQATTPVQPQPVKTDEEKPVEKPKAGVEPSKSTVTKENKSAEEMKALVSEKPQTPAQPKPITKKSDFDKSGHPTKEWIAANKLTLSNGMEFMKVPAGKFIMGSDPAGFFDSLLSDEKPKHTVNIPYDYWLARFPVTNELYNAYTRFRGRKHPVDDWEKKKNHPVVNASWTDAREYCQWLTELHRAELPLGLILRLPTEAEWEKAARGTDGRIYPWGEQFNKYNCNTSEGGKGGTTPVGMYSPHGESPYGCADMSGNVWEWTHSLMMPYPYNVKDGREDEIASGARVLRGGSFGINVRDARGASRSGARIDAFSLYLGFRVVVASPA